MIQRRWHGTLRRFAPALPVVMLLAACGVASLILSSCHRFSPDVAVPPEPLNFEGVPTVRVRITTRSVDAAELYTTGGYRILVDGREVGESTARLSRTTCGRSNERWTLGMLTATGKTLNLIPNPGTLVGYGKRRYRGRLVLHADGSDRFFVHNHVDMESYLASVVAKELYSDFHLETYLAQTVAARTYALYEIATRGQRSSFDVWDSQRSQVYEGMLAETNRSWSAVRNTHAQVLAFGQPGEERIFLTQFSACNGGYVNGAQVIRRVKDGEKIPPMLGGQKDGDGQRCPYYFWDPVQVRKQDLFRVLSERYESIRKLGNLETLRVVTRTDYDRPVMLAVVNKALEAVNIRAEDVRLSLLRSDIKAVKKLYSMNCKVRDVGDLIEFYDGRGFGHGVGLSQWGAEEKAQRGMKAEEILEFYYPEAGIFRAY